MSIYGTLTNESVLFVNRVEICSHYCGSNTFSGDKLCAIIIEGYKLAKSKAATGVILTPFLGSGT